MTIRITFDRFPAGTKVIRAQSGKLKYYCGGKRLPKFIWYRI